jgi:lysophospholipase L1-like esterase
VPAELSRRRRIAFGLVVAVFVLVAVEGLCQLAYRLSAGAFLFERTGAPIYEEDPARCYRVRSNLTYEHRTNEFRIHIYTNSQGMRTDRYRREVSPQKPPGTVRILFLGPSFTFGWGAEFEETYPTLVGEMLRGSGRPVEIVNLGTPAQGIEPQLCWLESVGRRYQPDLVVQTVYGHRVPSFAGECPERLACPVVVDSQLYTRPPTLVRRWAAYAKNLGIVFYTWYAFQRALGTADSGEVGIGKELHPPPPVDASDAAGLARGFERYERTIDRALGAQTEVVFLFIPMSYVVHPEDAPRWRHLLAADPTGARERIRSDVEAVRAQGHAIVDSTDFLVARGAGERLYHWLDVHLNPAGNRVVAEALLPALAERIGRSPRRRALRDASGPGG